MEETVSPSNKTIFLIHYAHNTKKALYVNVYLSNYSD